MMITSSFHAILSIDISSKLLIIDDDSDNTDDTNNVYLIEFRCIMITRKQR